MSDCPYLFGRMPDSGVIHTFIWLILLLISMDFNHLHCPECGEQTLNVEQPSDNEIWIKCSTCDLFMGLSEEEWHQIHNSPHLEKKIRALYEKDHPNITTGHPCRLCLRRHEGGVANICSSCLNKALIVILIIMVISSFIVWFGIF